MAVIELSTRIPRTAVQSYGGKKKREGARLNGVEQDELWYLWGAYSAALGVRSVQGAIEDRLRRGPPRDEIRRQVLDELERAGGRAPEGAVLRILVAEGVTRYEARRAVTMLLNHGKIERVPVESPTSEGRGLSTAQREWTGFDLRIPQRGELTMKLALRFVRRDPDDQDRHRWKKQDEALEREWQTLAVSDDSGGISVFEREESIAAKRRVGVERSLRALCAMPRHLVVVLRRVYADSRPGEDPLLAVAEYTQAARDEAVIRRAETVGAAIRARMKDAAWIARVKREADSMIAEACLAYREARAADR